MRVLKVQIDDDADLGAPTHKRRALIPVLGEWSTIACLQGYLVAAGYVRNGAAVALSSLHRRLVSKR